MSLHHHSHTPHQEVQPNLANYHSEDDGNDTQTEWDRQLLVVMYDYQTSHNGNTTDTVGTDVPSVINYVASYSCILVR